MNYFLLVLLPHLDTLLGGFGILGLVACLIAAIPLCIAYSDAYREEEEKQMLKIIKKFLYLFGFSAFLLFLTVPIPSKTELVQMQVVNVLQEVNGLDKIPQKIVDRINNLLDLVDDKKEDKE